MPLQGCSGPAYFAGQTRKIALPLVDFGIRSRSKKSTARNPEPTLKQHAGETEAYQYTMKGSFPTVGYALRNKSKSVNGICENGASELVEKSSRRRLSPFGGFIPKPPRAKEPFWGRSPRNELRLFGANSLAPFSQTVEKRDYVDKKTF